MEVPQSANTSLTEKTGLPKLNSSYPNKYWLNNAGLDGHSTFGHLLFLQKYVDSIKPAFIYFLIGCNDIGREDINNYDVSQPYGSKFYIKSPYQFFSHLYLFKLREKVRFQIFQKHLRGQYNIQHQTLDFTKSGILNIDEGNRIRKLAEHRSRHIPAYGNRLQRIIDICKQKKIHPIFITQPTLAGTPRDPSTGINMNTICFSDSLNGLTYWEILQQYNQETKDIASKNNIPVIDLAELMPKNSLYYYDFIHYTNEGAAVVSQIIFDETQGRKILGF